MRSCECERGFPFRNLYPANDNDPNGLMTITLLLAAAVMRQRERVSMSIIPTSDLDRYRQIVASVHLSPERKDEMIAIIYQMMRHFTDIAFGLSDAQIITAMQQRQAPAGSPDHARLIPVTRAASPAAPARASRSIRKRWKASLRNGSSA